MKKRMIALLLALISILACFSGCGESEKTKKLEEEEEYYGTVLKTWIGILEGDNSEKSIKRMYPEKWLKNVDQKTIKEQCEKADNAEEIATYGEGYDVSYTIPREVEIPYSNLQEYMSNITEKYGEEPIEVDREAYSFDLEITYKGTKDEHRTVASMIAIKIEGKFYLVCYSATGQERWSFVCW